MSSDSLGSVGLNCTNFLVVEASYTHTIEYVHLVISTCTLLLYSARILIGSSNRAANSRIQSVLMLESLTPQDGVRSAATDTWEGDTGWV